MANNLENMNALGQDANDQTLSPMEVDAVGEVMNICMGSAATAVSSMLDKPVNITTPKVTVEQVSQIDYGPLEPALIVKITYTEGVDGANVMVFRQNDMQMILNHLMGMGMDGPAEFVMDEISMSAACEVMNQMMGAAATALSEFLGKPINISTPVAAVMDAEHTFVDAMGLSAETNIVSILFDMEIQNVMHTQFVSVFSCDFAKSIVSQFVEEPAPAPAKPAPAPAPAPQPMQQAAPAQQPAPMQQMPQQAPPMQQMPPVQQMPPMQQPMSQGMPGYMDPMAMGQMGQYPYQPGMPPMGYPMGYPQYPPYAMPPQPAPKQERSGSAVNVQNVQFPEFGYGQEDGTALLGGNMNLIMNVPLNVEIVIGTTRRKIKDIMDFSQGTVIELDKQAGAPVDVVVNGQLLAHGDVVVIDDNFGVRITEIVGTKELLNSLDQQSR